MNNVLVVIGMQNDIISGALGTAAAAENADRVVKRVCMAHEEGERVIVVRDTHERNYFDTQEGRKLPVVHCVKNSVGWQLYRRLVDCMNNSHEIVDKQSFGSYELMERIGTSNPNKIEFVGQYTEVCVLVNAILAKTSFPEATVCINGSCCVGMSDEGQNAAYKIMNECHIDII